MKRSKFINKRSCFEDIPIDYEAARPLVYQITAPTKGRHKAVELGMKTARRGLACKRATEGQISSYARGHGPNVLRNVSGCVLRTQTIGRHEVLVSRSAC